MARLLHDRLGEGLTGYAGMIEKPADAPGDAPGAAAGANARP